MCSMRRAQTSATGFVASIINTNQRVNCRPGAQITHTPVRKSAGQHFTRARLHIFREFSQQITACVIQSCILATAPVPTAEQTEHEFIPMLRISCMELTVSLAALVILALVALLATALRHKQIDSHWENTVFLILKPSAT